MDKEAIESIRTAYRHLSSLYESGESRLTRRITWLLDDADIKFNSGQYEEGMEYLREAYRKMKKQKGDGSG